MTIEQKNTAVRLPPAVLAYWSVGSLGLLLLATSCEFRTTTTRQHDIGSANGSAVGSADGSTSIRFTEYSRDAGILFRHEPGALKYHLPEEMGAGAAFFDADGDDDLDVYLVQGGPIPASDGDGARGQQFFRNEGGGKFRNDTIAAGLGNIGYGMGCAATDYDNDGDTDLYVCNVGPDVLLANDGRGHFTNVTSTARLGAAGFSSSATFFDYDRDGWLDLFVTVYVRWSPDQEQPCYDPSGQQDYCNPTAYPPGQSRLYRNRGDGTFEDTTQRAGVEGRTSYGLGAVATDFDADGDADLFVANDHQPNFLWLNSGDGTFVEVATEYGCAYNADGRPEASMGIAVEDFDHDADFDFVVTNFFNETNTLYVNRGDGSFEDGTRASHLARHSVVETSFGIGFLDADNDGHFELYIANGAVMRRSPPVRADHPYAERHQLLRVSTSGKFEDITHLAGPGLEPIEMGRGAAFGDYDNDGDIDILVNNNRGPALLLKNETPRTHHWLAVKTTGTHSNRDGIGAWIDVYVQGRRLRRQVAPHASYQSSNDRRVHFGLGAASRVERLVVTWPSGRSEEWLDLPADRVQEVREGTGGLVANAVVAPATNSTSPSRAATNDGPSAPALPTFPAAVEFPHGDQLARQFNQQMESQAFEAALATAKEWLARARELGREQPHLAAAVSALLRVYAQRQEPTAALELLETQLAEYRAAGLADHPAVARFNMERARLLEATGRPAEAEAAHREACRICARSFGLASAAYRSAFVGLLRCFAANDRWELAEAELNSSLATLRASGASDDLAALASIESAFAEIARAKAQPLVALRHLEAARDAYVLGRIESAASAENLHSLGEFYAERRDYVRAAERFAAARDLSQRIFGARDTRTIMRAGKLAQAWRDAGRTAEAEELLLTTIGDFTSTTGAESLLTTTAKNDLAVLLVRTGRLREGRELLEAILGIYERELGSSHATTAQVRENLERVRRALENERP
ncbi:MAG: FG-GAP-like repeat-containing protein [Planctomycetota bacterium]